MPKDNKEMPEVTISQECAEIVANSILDNSHITELVLHHVDSNPARTLEYKQTKEPEINIINNKVTSAIVETILENHPACPKKDVPNEFKLIVEKYVTEEPKKDQINGNLVSDSSLGNFSSQSIPDVFNNHTVDRQK